VVIWESFIFSLLLFGFNQLVADGQLVGRATFPDYHRHFPI
jgi:hypothetical protein